MPPIAPPLPPSAAPRTAPTATFFTVSAVLSRLSACAEAYRLQASTTACVGPRGVRATRGAGTLAVGVAATTFVSYLSVPSRLATTSPACEPGSASRSRRRGESVDKDGVQSRRDRP